MWKWLTRLTKPQRPAFLAHNSFVRIVSMRGCMGHVRGEVRWAQVKAKAVGENYVDYVYVQFQDDGKHRELPAEPRLWVLDTDGVWEYRY